jgi:tetratricopeptide (TPR) repeat protein
MQLVAHSNGRCGVCLAYYTPEAMMEVLRNSLAHNWNARKHYCFTWALVRAGRAEEALANLRTLDHAALGPSSAANCDILEGRALLQLLRTKEALRCFQRAVRKVEGLPMPLIDIDVFANAKIGLGLVYTQLAKYGKAEDAISDAARMGVHASGSTLMKVYRAKANLVSAQGHHIEAWAFLLRRHKLAIQASKDAVLHAESIAEAHVARALCPGKKVAPEAMRRLLRVIRRTGKAEVVRDAACLLASSTRPKRRLRVKCHPEHVVHRGRCRK